jgi:small subunit ribosomal protein S20
MPQIKAAKKALRSSQSKRAVNDRWRRKVRQALHSVRDALANKDKKTAGQAYLKAQSTLDRAARRNIIHPNKAARSKSRLQREIAKLGL